LIGLLYSLNAEKWFELFTIAVDKRVPGTRAPMDKKQSRTPEWTMAILLLGGTCLLGFLLPRFHDATGVGVAILVVAFNLATGALALRRAAQRPSERLGWLLFCSGILVNVLARFAWILQPRHHITPAFETFLACTSPLASCLLALGAWSWPWRRQMGQRFPAFLGAFVFCLSFLLIPWIGITQLPFGNGHSSTFVLVLTVGSRLFIVGGLAAFLVVEDRRRVDGPLGWLLLNCVLLFLQLTFGSHGLNRFELVPQSPWLALTPLVSGSLLMVPFTHRTAEVSGDGTLAHPRLAGILLHLPFLVATALLGVALMRGLDPQPGPLAVYMLLAVALVSRQFLLQEALAASHREMEARVRSRTLELERLQDVVLLNERLNAVVVLGAGLVHDLNKGLGSILSAAEVLQMELERRMKVSGFAVEAIIQAVERSTLLSNRVMDFSRRLQEEGEIHDLRRELAALEGLLKLLVPCGIHLLLQPGQEPAPVRIHTEDLKQILVNLVTNARDALPGGGTIRLAVLKETMTGETYLDVEDTGTGIRPEHRPRIFEPFFTTKEPGAGTGLGLASVKILLEKAQGRVEVKSEAGCGTRFRLVFPPATVVA
jgi:signal transduction histidine kinase